MRRVKEIEQALREKFSGPIKEIKDFKYISWNDACDAANEIFGPMGWASSIKELHESKDGQGYESIVTIRVRAWNDEFSLVEETEHDGAGYADIMTTKSGVPIRDTAVKAAASDGVSRALKFFGDAFGLFLYDKEEAASTPASGGNSYTPRVPQSTGSGRSGRPTEKMIAALKRNRVPDDIIDQMSYEQASSAMNMFIKEGMKTAQVLDALGFSPVGVGSRRSPLDDLDEI